MTTSTLSWSERISRDLYVGFEHYIPIGGDPQAVAISSGVNTRAGCRNIAEFAFDYAVKNGTEEGHHRAQGKRAQGVDRNLPRHRPRGREESTKAALLQTIALSMPARCNSCSNPWQFDMIVTTNLFGDILSDELAGLIGGLGMAPGANIGADAAIFEAVHGSAPDIAGKGIANPLALLFAAAMMLEHVDRGDLAKRLRTAVDGTLREDNVRTGDLGGKSTTKDFSRAVVRRLS